MPLRMQPESICKAFHKIYPTLKAMINAYEIEYISLPLDQKALWDRS